MQEYLLWKNEAIWVHLRAILWTHLVKVRVSKVNAFLFFTVFSSFKINSNTLTFYPVPCYNVIQSTQADTFGQLLFHLSFTLKLFAWYFESNWCSQDAINCKYFSLCPIVCENLFIHLHSEPIIREYLDRTSCFEG